jgi:hypothetical protein
MIPIRIPGSIGRHNANLRVVATIGTLGYTHSDILKSKNWYPGQIIYTYPETVALSFEIVGRVNSKISGKLQSFLVEENFFRENLKKYKKNA